MTSQWVPLNTGAAPFIPTPRPAVPVPVVPVGWGMVTSARDFRLPDPGGSGVAAGAHFRPPVVGRRGTVYFPLSDDVARLPVSHDASSYSRRAIRRNNRYLRNAVRAHNSEQRLTDRVLQPVELTPTPDYSNIPPPPPTPVPIDSLIMDVPGAPGRTDHVPTPISDRENVPDFTPKVTGVVHQRIDDESDTQGAGKRMRTEFRAWTVGREPP